MRCDVSGKISDKQDGTEQSQHTISETNTLGDAEKHTNMEENVVSREQAKQTMASLLDGYTNKRKHQVDISSANDDFGCGFDTDSVPIVDLRSLERRRSNNAPNHDGTNGKSREDGNSTKSSSGRRYASPARLLMIRHGQSYANRSFKSGEDLRDPTPRRIDSPLTLMGKQQAFHLGRRMLSMHLSSGQRQSLDKDDENDKFHTPGGADVLIVTSPLSRAIETSLEVIRGMKEEFQSNAVQDSRRDAVMPNMTRLTILRCICEHVADDGDVGRPKEILMDEFKEISSELNTLTSGQWWRWAGSSRFCNNIEPFDSLFDRIKEFKAFVYSKQYSYKTIIVVGHSTFIQQLFKQSPASHKLKSTRRLKNCEIVNVKL